MNIYTTLHYTAAAHTIAHYWDSIAMWSKAWLGPGPSPDSQINLINFLPNISGQATNTLVSLSTKQFKLAPAS